jgi:WD40 repeat protein
MEMKRVPASAGRQAAPSLRNPSAELKRLERERPDVVSLGMLASLARHVEPELLRALRLTCGSHFGASDRPRVDTEAAVWFGPFVETRGPDGITFYADYAALLRRRLRGTPVLFELAHTIIAECHRSVPPVARWEEEMIYIALAGLPDPQRQKELEEAAWRALKAVSSGDRPGLEEWVVDMWDRLPEAARQNFVLAQLRAVSEERVRLREGRPRGATAGTERWPEIVLDVERSGDLLRIGYLPGARDLAIPVPDLDPVTIETSDYTSGSVVIPKGEFVKLHVRRWPVRLQAADGRVYEIEQGASPTRDPRFAFDVFLSHNAKDKPRVRRLAEHLQEAGLRVWFDDWRIQPGDDISLGIERGLDSSRVQVLCLSRAALESDWVQLERNTVIFRDPTNVERRFIPLLLEDCRLPDTISRYRYVDYRQEQQEALAELLAACQPGLPARVTVDRTTTLRGHTGQVRAVAATPDGRLAVSASYDGTVGVWDLTTGQGIRILKGHNDRVLSVAVSPDGSRAISGSADGALRIWNLSSGQSVSLEAHEGEVFTVAFAPDGRTCLSGSYDRAVRVWDAETLQCVVVLTGHQDSVLGLACTPDGRAAVSCSGDRAIRVWDLSTGRCMRMLRGHSEAIDRVAVTPDGRAIVTISRDCTVRFWDLAAGHALATFEGHTAPLLGLCCTPDARYIVTTALDRTLRIWDSRSAECLAVEETPVVLSLAVTSDGKRLIGGCADGRVLLWDFARLLHAKPRQAAVRYVSAKVVLLGEGSVGKTSLAHRLVEDQYVAKERTHGMSVWQLELPDSSDITIQREVLLWDLAGQEDYRLIHRMFLDQTALALLLIHPRRDDPFAEALDWLSALDAAAGPNHKPARLLIFPQADTGGLTLSNAQIDHLCREHNIAGWLQVSAKTGHNCSDDANGGKPSRLKQLIAASIPWDRLPWTSTPRVVAALKDAIIAIRSRQEIRLLRFSELVQRLERALPGEDFTESHMRNAVALLANHGLVQPLKFGDLVLLEPELLNGYASAIIRAARLHRDEIGSVPEAAIYDPAFDFTGIERLPRADEELLLRAIVQTFLEHSLCIAQDSPIGRLLVFPSQFRREREIPSHPDVFISYTFRGDWQTIWTTLVVRLWYSQEFERRELWRNAAEFASSRGHMLGLKIDTHPGGEATINLFFDPRTPDESKVIFIEYVHRHLAKYGLNVTRNRHYVCPACGTGVRDPEAVRKRLEAGKDFITCQHCDSRVPLVDEIERRLKSGPVTQRILAMEEKASRELDSQALEQILIGHVMAIVGEANQIFRPFTMFDQGIDGEIEFKDEAGRPSGKKIYVQLKSGNSYLRTRRKDGREVFDVKAERQLEYWIRQAADVYLIIRQTDEKTGESIIRWMNVTRYLKEHGGPKTRQIVFSGEKLTMDAVWRARDLALGSEPSVVT